MTFILSWIVYPVVVFALALGAGMGLRRLAGVRALPGVLVLPAGMVVIVTISALTTQFDATAELTGPCLLAVAAGGLLAARRSLTSLRPSRAWGWPALAAILPAGAIAAPIVLTGKPGATGYTRIPDLTHQLEFTDWITSAGRVIPSVTAIDSSFMETVIKMTSVGYPGGSQAALGGTSALIGVDPLWSYQAFLALIAGGLGLALYALLGRAIPSRGWRAVAAGVAAQPTILYSYALAAGIKELSAIAALTLVAALLFARRPADAGLRELAPVAVASAAAFAVFSLGIVPWIGILVAVVLVADLVTRRTRVRTLANWGALGVGVAVLSIPTIAAAFKLAPVAADGGPPDLGNLAAPVRAGPRWVRGSTPITGSRSRSPAVRRTRTSSSASSSPSSCSGCCGRCAGATCGCWHSPRPAPSRWSSSPGAQVHGWISRRTRSPGRSPWRSHSPAPRPCGTCREGRAG